MCSPKLGFYLGKLLSNKTGLGGFSNSDLVLILYIFNPVLFEKLGWTCINFLKKCNIVENTEQRKNIILEGCA